MIKKLLLLTSSVSLAIGVSANINTSEIEKFNSAKSSVSFTENKGQISDQNYNPRPDVLFSGAANGLQFYIRKDGISYQTSRVDSWKQQDENLSEGMREEVKADSVTDQMTIYRTDINWLGCNKDYTIENGEAKAGFNNYYLPSSPDGAMNVKSYMDVTFKNLYDGLDVKWYEKNGELEYDFIVAPNTDYTKISWEIKGADRISIGENGQLIIETPLGDLEEQAPMAFQGKTIVEAAWKIEGNKISFQLGSYDENEVLIIDPVVRLWGTYYGGTGNETGRSCATDANGNVYLAGYTQSTTGIATTGSHQTTFAGGSYDGFLVKFNSSGARQWGTYYGATGYETGYSCATDASGNVYLAGFTSSTTGIATTGSHQTTFGGGSRDGFLVKFNSSGSRQWGTYFGGTAIEGGYSCATDASGNVYLSGFTTSTTGIATTGSHQTTYRGNRDGFLVKFNSRGALQWGTYYGGTGNDYGHSCATDASGNVYLVGDTRSTSGIATTGSHQTINGGSLNGAGNYDTFLVKFNSSGARQWGTYYGGTSDEYGYSCATDTSGNIYLAGYAQSTTGIATTGSHQTTKGSNRFSGDAFLVKFDGCGAVYSQDTITACDSYTWIDGVTYTLSDTTTKDTLVNVGGCDSIVTLYLTINNSTSAIDTVTACDSYTWKDGVIYTLSDTTAKDTLVNIAGCDSIVTLYLTINNSTSAIDTVTACDSHTWVDGVTYTSSDTTARYTLVNAVGCDSIVTLNLSISYTKTFTDSIVANDSYTWIDEVTYTSSDTTATDTLEASNGCDSIVSLNLTIVSTVGIDNPVILSNVKVYPNPTSCKLTIDAENYEGVEVYDVSGRLIIKSELNTIDLEEQSKGLYILKVNVNGTTQEFKVFKE